MRKTQSSKMAAQRVDEFRAGVASTLRRLRLESALSLAQLAARSGVSQAMLSQVESGKTTPSIAVLWKIADGLRVPFSALLGSAPSDPTVLVRRAEGRVIVSADGTFRSRPLFAPGPGRRVEFYQLEIDPGGRSRSRPHVAGTVELLVVVRGGLRLDVHGTIHTLAAGDSIEFPADVEHAYQNPGRSLATAFDVIVYP